VRVYTGAGCLETPPALLEAVPSVKLGVWHVGGLGHVAPKKRQFASFCVGEGRVMHCYVARYETK
jgi:hypothetical protein